MAVPNVVSGERRAVSLSLFCVQGHCQQITYRFLGSLWSLSGHVHFLAVTLGLREDPVTLGCSLVTWLGFLVCLHTVALTLCCCYHRAPGKGSC